MRNKWFRVNVFRWNLQVRVQRFTLFCGGTSRDCWADFPVIFLFSFFFSLAFLW
uniref:Uncharacterized protein n=1 Tax=Anguilla anguilla TaxID=7936 RepID=A0A0E9XM51_ANGAN